MNDEPDSVLLRRYADHGAEAAFAEVVCRQVNLVYSAALRLTGGQAPLAEEVTQSVFAELARQADTLAGRPTLTGWLHTTTRYQASKAIRAERRRRAREQEAFLMQNEPSSAEIPWEQLRPVLDEAVGHLSEADRDLVTLRFFTGKSHGETGAILGISEDTARKRVERAVEKLRAYFGRRGVTISTGLMAAAITANSVQAAPAELAGGITVASLTQAAAGSAGLMSRALLMTTKTKILLIVALAVALVGFPVTFSLLQTGPRSGAIAPTANAQNSQAAIPVRPPSPVEAPRLPPQASAGAAVAGALSSSGATAAPTGTATKPALAAGRTGTAVGTAGTAGAANLFADPAIPLSQRIAALTTGAPVTTKPVQELSIPDPTLPNTRVPRPDILQISLKDDTVTDPRDYATGTAYYLPVENRFYLVWEKAISSTIHWYGPFDGNPRDVLNLPESKYPATPANNSAQ